jgi:hypothetical protein
MEGGSGCELSVTKEDRALNSLCDASSPFHYHIWVSLAGTNKCAKSATAVSYAAKHSRHPYRTMTFQT